LEKNTKKDKKKEEKDEKSCLLTAESEAQQVQMSS
jgi:hypothetical protein